MNATPQLDALYRAAEYAVVDAEAVWVCSIDRRCVGIAALLDRNTVHTAALLTAWNPHGHLLALEQNRLREHALIKQLDREGFRHLPAEGRAKDGSWFEAARLILACSAEQALELALQWEQVAWLQFDPDGTPRLHYSARD